MTDDGGPCIVRAARSNDLLDILTVHGNRDPGGEIPTAASEVERQTWTLMMHTENLTVYIAEIDGNPVGTATLLTMPNVTYGCAPTAFIEAVVVVHSHRRRGIATALMHKLLSDAQSAGCNKVQLLSHKRHEIDGAHSLYTKLGFDSEAEGFRLYLRNVPPAVQAARASLPGQP